jgi:uncharacterized protein YpbB
MDLGDVFEPGMGYVALSRVRSLTGLKLMNLNEMALKVHPKILQHDKVFRDNSDVALSNLQALSEQEKEQCQKETLITRFRANAKEKIKAEGNNKRKKSSKVDATPTHMITLELIKEHLSIQAIAEKRELTVGTIIGHIEKLQSLKKIDDEDYTACIDPLRKMIPDTDFNMIFFELLKSEDGKLKSIYEKFEGKYSYADIKIVSLFVDKS